jgi:ATP-dependent DNA helicase RecQ
MRRQRALPIALPDRPTRAKPGERAGKAQMATEEEGAYDDAVYTALKNWRREKAEELGGLPAYLIYADRTLRDLARALPQDLESLVRVRGIGPAKARQFGEDTLLIIRQAADT